MTQESRLVITVDSRKAKTELDSVDKSLKSVEKQGQTTSKAADATGKKIKGMGDQAKQAADGIKSVSGVLGQFTSGLKGSMPSLSAVTTGIAGLAGAAVGSLGALTGLALAYANNAKEIQNFATVADMGVVEFQRMAVAAQQVGITQEQLSDQIKDFNEKLGEFVLTGKGEATDAFELLQKHSKMSGEEIKKFALEMQKASGGDAMQMYVNKLEEAGVSQEQMSFLTENMANDFTKLLPIFQDNGAAIEAWGDAAQRAGAIMDEEAIAKANELTTQSNLLQLQLQGMSNTILAAVVPALVDIADAFFQDSEQGNYFAQIGDILAKGLKTLSTVAISVATSFNVVGESIGGAAAAMQMFLSGDFKGAASTIKATFNAAVDNVTNARNQIGAIWTGSTANSIKGLNIKQPTAPRNGGAGVTSGLSDFIAGENKKTAAAKKSGQQRNRDAEQLERERQRIIFEYADEEARRKIELQEEIARLEKAGMTEFIAVAKNRYEAEERLIKMKHEFDLVEHRLTEEQKLRFTSNIKEMEIKADKNATEQQRKDRQASLKSQFEQELSNIRLAKEQRIFAAQEALMSEMAAIKRKYELERQEISKIQDLQERSALLNASFASQSKDEASVRDQAISDYRGVMGFEESPLVKQFEVLDKMRELDLISEEKYQQDKLMLQTKYSASYMQSMLGGFMSLVDENSSAYAAMFAAQKAFAVAQALINIPATYSNTVNAISAIPLIGPYIAPAMGAAAAALQVAQAASIKSTNMSGFKSGGYTGNYGKSDVAGVVHGQEYVLNAEATKRVGVNTLNAINNGSTIQAERQAQANAKASSGNSSNINLNPNFVIVDEREKLGDYLYSPDGKKAFVKFFKQNRRELGFA